MKPNELITKIENGELDKSFKKIYVSDSAVEAQKPRYIRTIKEFINLFGDDRDVFVLSAPGRTEVCGNHTDHNNGKVLAASINLDAIAIAAKGKVPGILLIISSIAGAILGGTFVAIFMVLSLVGGILAVIGTKRVPPPTPPPATISID